MNVWMDDVRDPEYHEWIVDPIRWTVVRTAQEAWDLLKTGKVEYLSLDHDMGENQFTGYALLCWMEEHNVWSKHKPIVHSMNPVGAMRMRQVIERKFK